MSGELVELSEAIEVVREQLIKAQRTGQQTGTANEVTFEVGTVSIEFTGEVSKTVGVGGGVKFWVASADAKGERSSGTSQKVTVELKPLAANGTSYRVNDDTDTPPPN